MANVFGILTALLLAIAAFVAKQNKDRYTQEITTRTTSEATEVKTKKKLDDTRKDLEKTTADHKATDAEVAKLTREKNGLETGNGKLKTEIEEKTALSAKQKAQLDETNEQLSGTGDLKTLGDQLKATNAAIEGLKQTISSSEGTLANLISESEKVEKSNEGLRNIGQLYPAKKSNPSLKTRIVSVYPNWGFVTLGAGNSSGVVTNSTLEVVRGGETVAKLLVTAAEGSTASATIVPDSQKPDTTLMVGDSVVPAK